MNEHTSINALIDLLAEKLATRITEKLKLDYAERENQLSGVELNIHPDRFYTAKDLAARWFGGRVQSVHEISPLVLPRAKVGAKRGKSLFYGLDVMRYEGQVSDELYARFKSTKSLIIESNLSHNQS